jgi:CheY-like chemotaxis protein
MKTILIVEDNDDQRHVLSTKLMSAGFDVVPTTNGQEGLDIVSARQIDLILLDLMMPQMNGQEFIHELKGKMGRNIPIIILSNLTTAAFPEGIDAYLVKSETSLEEIVNKIKHTLGK